MQRQGGNESYIRGDELLCLSSLKLTSCELDHQIETMETKLQQALDVDCTEFRDLGRMQDPIRRHEEVSQNGKKLPVLRK